MDPVKTTHDQAAAAIQWLTGYFRSLKDWLRELGAILETRDWIALEPNRISWDLGNGMDSGEWVLTWVWRHFYRKADDRTLFVKINLCKGKAGTWDPMRVMFASVEYPGLSEWGEREEIVPKVNKAWKSSLPLTTLLHEAPEKEPRPLSPQEAEKAFGTQGQVQALWIGLEAFGESSAQTQDQVVEALRRLGLE
jgi:hypothetical protein